MTRGRHRHLDPERAQEPPRPEAGADDHRGRVNLARAAVRTPVTRSPAVRIASTGTYWTTVAPSSRARVAKAFVVIAASA